jgi:hypothetical protein
VVDARVVVLELLAAVGHARALELPGEGAAPVVQVLQSKYSDRKVDSRRDKSPATRSSGEEHRIAAERVLAEDLSALSAGTAPAGSEVAVRVAGDSPVDALTSWAVML